MKKHTGLSSGLSLVELVVTLVIGGIFFFMIGAIIIYSQESWLRSKKMADVLDDYQFTSKRLNYLIRQGSTIGFPADSSSGSGLSNWEFAVYTKSGLQYNRIVQDGNALVRFSGTSPTPTTNKEVLMRNVSNVSIRYDGPHNLVELTVTQVSSTSYLSNGRISRPRTITIHRNKTSKATTP